MKLNGQLSIEFDAACWSCAPPNGAGTPVIAEDDGTCSICRGRQRVTTDEGNELLAFLRRHLKPECFTEGK